MGSEFDRFETFEKNAEKVVQESAGSANADLADIAQAHMHVLMRPSSNDADRRRNREEFDSLVRAALDRSLKESAAGD